MLRGRALRRTGFSCGPVTVQARRAPAGRLIPVGSRTTCATLTVAGRIRKRVEIGRASGRMTKFAIRVTRFPAVEIDIDDHFAPSGNVPGGKPDQRTTLLGTARPFPLWRLHSGPQSSSVDQCSEMPPEHLKLTIADSMRRSVVTRNCLKKFRRAKRLMQCLAWSQARRLPLPKPEFSQRQQPGKPAACGVSGDEVVNQ